MLHLMPKIKTLIGKSKVEKEPPIVITNERLKLECQVEYLDEHYHITFVDLLTRIEWKSCESRFLNRDKAIERAQQMVLLSSDDIIELNAKAS
jgi:hypothetical protein